MNMPTDVVSDNRIGCFFVLLRIGCSFSVFNKSASKFLLRMGVHSLLGQLAAQAVTPSAAPFYKTAA